MRNFWASVFFGLSVSSASASPIEEYQASIMALSEGACLAEEQKIRLIFESHDKDTFKSISFVAEGTRLLCESIRIASEQQRLGSEQERLRMEAARLEQAWQEAHSINPSKFPDFAGRDASQRQLLADADTIEGTIRVLGNVRGDLEGEARRILLLANAEFSQLNADRAELVLASLDGEDEYDVIIRLLEQQNIAA